MPQRPPIFLYTDGAASGNPGPGGYGIVLVCGKARKEMSGGFALTTNNRMELLAVILGLEAVRWEHARIEVWSDSSGKRRIRTCGCASWRFTENMMCLSTGSRDTPDTRRMKGATALQCRPEACLTSLPTKVSWLRWSRPEQLKIFEKWTITGHRVQGARL